MSTAATNSALSAFTVRPAVPTDAHFIMSSWLNSLNEHVGAFDRAMGYWEGQKKLIALLLESPDASALVAVDAEDAILGWVVGERGPATLLHFVYVRKRWRRQNLGNALVRALHTGDERRVVCTHQGFPWTRQKRKERGWRLAERGVFYRALLQQGE